MSSSEVKNRFLKLTNWLYLDHNTIYSHAGVSRIWLNSVEQYIISKSGSQYNDNSIDTEVLLKLINNIEPCELFGFIPNNRFDYYGDSETQPLTWIRPGVLCTCNLLGYDQVVGHTVTGKIVNMKQTARGNQNIWLCDSLGFDQYLKIQDNVFVPCNL